MRGGSQYRSGIPFVGHRTSRPPPPGRAQALGSRHSVHPHENVGGGPADGQNTSSKKRSKHCVHLFITSRFDHPWVLFACRAWDLPEFNNRRTSKLGRRRGPRSMHRCVRLHVTSRFHLVAFAPTPSPMSGRYILQCYFCRPTVDVRPLRTCM
jgi:hypothetical protein